MLNKFITFYFHNTETHNGILKLFCVNYFNILSSLLQSNFLQQMFLQATPKQVSFCANGAPPLLEGRTFTCHTLLKYLLVK